ncbi:MAG: ABC transporter ATP-binding protein [Nanoarchaeota archaeon]
MAMPLLQFKDVTKQFGKHLVLDKVSFDIYYKDIFGLIGLSGCGKTTILNIIIGFYKETKGNVYFHGEKIKTKRKIIQGLFGFASQGSSFYGKLTVKENLEYFGLMYNMPVETIDRRINELLNLVELSYAKDTIAENLSTGMQRRLDIACAMIHNPEVLILDEPTEDLDPVLRKEMLALIKKINNDEGTTIIITSHLLGEVELICSEIAIIQTGKIIEMGTPDQIKKAYSKNQEIHIMSKPGNYDKLIKNIGQTDISKIIKKPHKIVIYTPNGQQVLHRVMQAIKRCNEEIIEISLAKPSLEEVFEAVTQKRFS